MDTSGTPVTLTRTIKASPQELFAAWTDPSLIPLWMDPGPDGETVAEVDARVGGRYRLETRIGDAVHVTVGEYRELVPGRRLVKTWIYRGPIAEFADHETLLTVEFREAGPGLTEMTLRHERFPSARYSDSVQKGWGAFLDNFEKLAAEGRLAPSRAAS